MEQPRPPRPLPESHPLFAREDWPVIRKKTKVLAYRVRPSIAEAQDLAHAAILSCIQHEKEPWRLPPKALFAWLARRVAFIAFHERRHDQAFPKDPIAEEGAHDLDDGTSYGFGHILHGPGPTPEDAYISAETESIYQRRLESLLRRIADDALASLLVAEVTRQAEAPMAAALAQGFTSDDIYNARKRIERAARAVLDDERNASSKKEQP
jgi:hypothetical protein